MCATAVHPEVRVEIFCVPASAARKVAGSLGREVVEYHARTGTLLMPALTNDVSWEQYKMLLETLPDHRMRHTYDRGALELMKPSGRQAYIACLVGRLIETFAYKLNLPILSAGSATLYRKSVLRGLEPDESYYIAHERDVRGKLDYDPDRDPPPDLVIEVDVRRPAVERMAVYAALGVPEIWRHDGERKLSFHRLAGGKYEAIEHSDAFPYLAPDDISAYLDQMGELDENSIVRAFVKHALAKKAERGGPRKKRRT